MSAARWAISLYLVLHVGGLALASLPELEELQERDVEVRQHVDGAIAGRIAPTLDRAAAALVPGVVTLWNATAAVRPVSAMYVEIMGLGQRWHMFGNPPQTDQYLRLRYYVGPAAATGARATWTATEVVFPAQHESEIRLLQAYRDSYRDKAMAIALQRHQAKVRQRLRTELESGTPAAAALRPDQLPDDLAPVGRYFARRFARARLDEDERIFRTDVWWGVVSNPPPGRSEPSTADDRQIVLSDYYRGPIERRIGSTAYPPIRAVERESDITWRLEYFEQR